jgi:hypothetical protein
MSSVDWEKAILSAIREELFPLGFRKRGKRFFAERDDMELLVELQRGRYSTKEVLICTVNVGVRYRPLKVSWEDTQPLDAATSHWSTRLGSLMPIRDDVWWRVVSMPEAERAGEEIAGFLKAYGLPAMFELGTPEALLQRGELDLARGATTPGRMGRESRRFVPALRALLQERREELG